MTPEVPHKPTGTRARRMHATLREEDLKVPRQDRKGRLRVVAATGLCALLVLALTMTAVLHAGRQAIAESVSSLATRLGVEVQVEFVTFDFMDGLTLQGLRLNAPEPHDLAVVVERATTNIGLWALVTGTRKPSELTLERLHAHGRVDEPAMRWLRELRGAKRDRPKDETKSGWRGTVRVVDGSAQLDLHAEIGGLPRTQQSVAFKGWSATLTRQATVEFDAAGGIAIEGEHRNAQLGIRNGPDAAFHITLDDPIGVKLSGMKPSLQVQIEAIQWARRHGTVQLHRVAVERGETKLALKQIDLAGGNFPWLGADVPRSLAIHGIKGTAAGRHVSAHRGSVTLGASTPELASWAPTPREVRLEGIRFGHDTDLLQATLQRLTLGLDPNGWKDALAGKPSGLLREIDVQGPTVTLELAELALLEDTAVGVTEGSTNRASLLEALASSDGPLVIPGASAFIADMHDHRLSVTQGRLVVRSGDDDKSTPAQLDDVSLTWAPDSEGGGTASGHALVQRGAHRSGRLDVTANVDAGGAVRDAQGAISGTGFAHVLSKLSDYVTVQPEAWLKADFAYAHVPDKAMRHRITGEVRFEDFGFEAWRISHSPVLGLEGALRYTASIEPREQRLSFEVTEATMSGAEANAAMTMTFRPDKKPVVNGRIAMPSQDCGQLARAVPRALLPRLKGLKLAGKLKMDADFSVDLEEPNSFDLSVDGSVDRCRVVTLGGDIDLETLRGDFVHHPVEPKRGRREDIAVGRGTPQWIETKQLPVYLRAAAISTEDRAFRQHQGVRWDLLAKAIRLNLEKSKFAYGGSTITQQLVKNLYLTREKTLSRKLEELIISWELERRFDKREILELYVNVIEYGPDIYGVRKAAHYYFGKPPWLLNPAEAAFIMGLKPYPRAGHRQWQARQLNAWWLRRVRNVMRSVQKNEGALTNSQISSASANVTFRPPGASFWSGVKATNVSEDGNAAVQGQ